MSTSFGFLTPVDDENASLSSPRALFMSIFPGLTIKTHRGRRMIYLEKRTHEGKKDPQTKRQQKAEVARTRKHKN